MSTRIIRFPLPPRQYNGTVHVMGDSVTGFEIGHESASGNSWGSFSGPFRTAQAAIAAANALNRDSYNGDCDVHVCDAAKHCVGTDAGAPPHLGEF